MAASNGDGAPAVAAGPADPPPASDKPAAADAPAAKAEPMTFGSGERRVYPVDWLKLRGREYLSLDLLPATVASSDVNKHNPAEHATADGGGGLGGGGLGGGLGGGGGLDMARSGRTVPPPSGGSGGLFPERGSALGRAAAGGAGSGGLGGGLDMADPRGSMRLPAATAAAANGGSGTGRAAPAPPRSGGLGVLGSYTAPLPSRSASSTAGLPEPDFGAARGSMKVLPPPSSPGTRGTDLTTARTPRTGGMAPAGGDPRGSGGGGAFGSGRRDRAGGYADMFDPRGSKVQTTVVPPQPELKKSGNAWARNREADDEVEAKVKQVRSLLNKLTLEKFDKIYTQIKAIEVSSPEVLDGIVAEVFQKALSESNFAGMYADLCSRLSKENLKLTGSMADAPESEKQKLNFRRILLTNCQSEFDRFANEETLMNDLKTLSDEGTLTGEDIMKVVTKAREKKSAAMNEFVDKLEVISKQETVRPEDIGVVIGRAKRRMLGNVMFIGELFKKKLIMEKIIHTECIQRLLTISKAKKEEDVIEALIQLVSTTGKLLSMNTKARPLVDNYFKDFALLSRDKEIPSRVRFLLKDLLDLRDAGWQGRRDDGAKTIAEIHADIEKEEKEKEAAAAAAASSARSRDTRGFGGRGGYGRDMRGPIPTSHHAVSMHIPSAARGGSGAGGAPAARNRLSAAWESVERKEAAAAATQMSADATTVKLRPGGLRPGGGGGLRPGGRGRAAGGDAARPSASLLSNSFAQLSESAGGTMSLRPGGGGRGAAPKPAAPKPAPSTPSAPPGLSKDALKRKTKSILSEYLSIKDVKEALECVKEEVPASNYTGFVQTAMRNVLELRVQEREVMLPLFEAFASGSVLPHSAFVDAFSDVVKMLDDLDIDDPKACEYVGKYLGRLAAVGAFTPKAAADAAAPSGAGLGFLGSAVKEIENPALAVKLIIGVFANFKAALVAGAGGREVVADDAASAASMAAYTACGVDLEALAAAVPGGGGEKVLGGTLEKSGMGFLLPLRAAGAEIAKRLRGGTPVADVQAWMEANVADAVRASPAFVRTLAAAALGMAVAPTLSAGERGLTADVVSEEARLLKDATAPLLRPAVDGNVDAQVAVLLEVQAICYRARFPGAGTLTGPDGKPRSPLVRRLFDGLYDHDVIDEESANAWKDRDPGADDSGKTEALVQTNAWFEWLATAEEEDDK